MRIASIRNKCDVRRLDGVRSLSRLVKRLGRTDGEADWTGALDRARRLVEAAERVRRTARPRLRSLHIAASGRVIYARARRSEHLAALTPELGDHFARALAGTGLVVTIVTRTAPPPADALRVADFERAAERTAERLRAASAALAVGGLATFNAGVASAQAKSDAAPLASLTTMGDWACGLSPTDRLWTVRVRLIEGQRSVELVDGDAVDGAKVVDYASTLDEGVLRADPLGMAGPNDERIVGITRYPEPSGDRFDLTIASCPLPPPRPLPAFERAYSDYGADFIDRTVQNGAVASGTVQLEFDNNTALNLQGAVGSIDHDAAIGGQVAVQRYMPVGGRAEAAVGAFLSAVTSRAPDDDDFPITRGGVGVSVIGEETQIIVRAGYAQSSDYHEAEGGFVRVEAGWFPVERLSLDVFVEDDPITGTGAGAGFAARPFSGAYSSLMIDADAAWHEDGEESFRVGFRWTFGDTVSSERDRRRRRGMAPYLPQEFERLPEDGSNTQSYCGEAACDGALFHD